jgi:hypothetical protein
MKSALTAALAMGFAIALVRCDGDSADESPSTIPDDVLHDDPSAAGGSPTAEDIGGDASTETEDASVTVFTRDSAVDEDAGPITDECAAVTQQADIRYRPVDIVFIIDNSSSMQEEIAAVQDRINADFARIIEESGVDYRVIMFSRYGALVPGSFGSDQHFICVRAPLGASDCADPDNTPLQHNAPRFYHYSTFVASNDALCVLLRGWDQPDETVGSQNLEDWAPIAPRGYSEFLRPDAIKHFVVITDDQVDCEFDDEDDAPWAGVRLNDRDNARGGQTVAEQFDEFLLTLAPEQFGTAEDRHYRWHSIVGLADNTPATEPWPPTAPVETGRCGEEGESVAAGTGYQALSELTGGLRYPICQHQNFDAVFQALAASVVTGSRLACEWELPEPETGEPLDPEQVNVEYTGGGMTTSAIIPKVEGGAASCTESGGWYYDSEESPTRILTCPATCAVLEADAEGTVDIALGCATIVS